jgi:DNA invertase Pin-like site-specific DNA recombinase
MIHGYARSTNTISVQLKALIKYGINIDNVIIDTCNSLRDDRKNLKTLLESLRSGDVLIFWSLECIAKNLYDLNRIINDLNSRNIYFKSLSQPYLDTDTENASKTIVFEFFRYLLDFERYVRSEKTIIGLDRAREKGRKIGHPKGVRKSNDSKFKMCIYYFKENKLKVNEICERVGVCRGTYYNYLRRAGYEYRIRSFRKN